jgi:subtilisin family serine protease
MRKPAAFISLLLILFVLCSGLYAVSLVVDPVDDFEPSGEPGGPFTPSSIEYQLTNTDSNSIWWGVYWNEAWLDIDPEFGPLASGFSVNVTVSLTPDADLLGEGVYTDLITFIDITNEEEQTRDVNLTIAYPPPPPPPGGIWIDPNTFDFNVTEGTTLTENLTIGNDGDDTISFILRSRLVGGSGGTGLSTLEQGGLSSIPEGRDFTIVADEPFNADRVLVRFAPASGEARYTTAEKNDILSTLGGGTVEREFAIVPGLSLVELPTGMTVEEALQEYNQSPDILYAEPDYEIKLLSRIPDDTRFDELWGMHNTGQSGGTVDADIDAPEAWEISTGSDKVVVALLDTGVDYGHVDLSDNMWVNEDEYNGSGGVDDDGNGYIDDIYGWDFADDDADPMDYHYHGTHCAGTIGGVGNNGKGVAGVCWDVKIMTLKIFPNYGETGFIAGVIEALDYAIDKGIKVSSNSWGGGSYSQSLKDAINTAGGAGMLFIASAGNDGVNNDTYPHYPASYNCESIISVLATNDNDNKSGFSNYGPTSVDIGAPGSDILSCEPGNQYQYLDGTSMATPHVAGACALLWSMNPALSNAEVKGILLNTVDKTLPNKCVSEGRLNLYNAILETNAPWISFEPEEGELLPDEAVDVNVTFDAMELEPGTYEAEIVVISDDPCNPTMIVPVTMTVVPDDLVVTPTENFESTGTKGGPFEPNCITYTLTNQNPLDTVAWTSMWTGSWLEVDPFDGILDPCASIDVNVCIASEADLLNPNIYTDTLIFENLDSGSIKDRLVSLTVEPPDTFTESFDQGAGDLESHTLMLIPYGTSAYYAACEEEEEVEEFSTDPCGGTIVYLGDDDFWEVVLDDGDEISFFGTSHDRFYIGSNGYITFGEGDTEYLSTLSHHFNMPRISGMFVDLDPANGEDNVSYKKLDDRVAVTFENVPLYPNKTGTNSFQIELFFDSGEIRMTWLDTEPTAFIAGISEGYDFPPFFVESDLTSYLPCCPCGDFDGDKTVDFGDYAAWALYWLYGECEIPTFCGRADLDRSGSVDGNDMSLFAANWLYQELHEPPEEPCLPGPISHWKFDEGEGTIAYDSADGHDGTIIGAEWIDGKIGTALDFDGLDKVEVEGNVEMGKDFTMSAWVNRGIIPDIVGHILVKGDVGESVATDLKSMGVLEDGSFRVLYEHGGGTNYEFVSNFDLEIDVWYFLTVVRDDSDNSLRLYVNGALVDGDSSTPDPSVNSASFRIGMWADGNYGFNGIIDNARIYNRSLSADEIEALYEEGAGLVSHWKFDEGEGIIAVDSVGDNNGLLHGDTHWVEGKIGDHALEFDGDNDYVSVGKSYENNTVGTICGWVFPKTTVSSLFWAGDNDVFNEGVQVIYGGNGIFRMVVRKAAGYEFIKDTYGTFPVNNWYHYCFVQDGISPKLYINGTEVSTSDVKTPKDETAWFDDVDGIDEGSIGMQRDSTPWGSFDGIIDDVRIYNRALSAKEIQAIYEEGGSVIEGVCQPR